jgi:hypothetical protein
MKLKIRQHNIDRASVLCRKFPASGYCAIAMAARDLGHKNVSVNYTEVYLGKDRYRLGEDALVFMRAFDGRERVQPCIVELVPDFVV